ncbi:MAG: DUF2683 family protein [Candidatus Thermoplasmatota archaeon]|nr:DUF2683 family protein [Candidatus Thermoplasmatota archaeon]
MRNRQNHKKLKQELRPEYVKKIQRIEKGTFIQFSSIEELRKLIET